MRYSWPASLPELTLWCIGSPPKIGPYRLQDARPVLPVDRPITRPRATAEKNFRYVGLGVPPISESGTLFVTSNLALSQLCNIAKLSIADDAVKYELNNPPQPVSSLFNRFKSREGES
jgi:hypothetical protein